jgi:hypothetical protein
MLISDVDLPVKIDFRLVERTVEKYCQLAGLSVTVKTTLLSCPGSIHWHFKKGTERGSLEATLWEKGKRLWFPVDARREGTWTQDAMVELKSRLERQLKKEAGGFRDSGLDVPVGID